MNGSAQETLRIGTVTKVDKDKMTARVKFADKDNMTSGELNIMQRPRHVIPYKKIYVDEEKENLTTDISKHNTLPVPETREKVEPAQGEAHQEETGTPTHIHHNHAAYIDEWIPKIGTMVVCLIVPYGDGDGVIIGQIGE